MDTPGKRIKNLREKLGIGQIELAEKLDKSSKQTISNWENDRSEATIVDYRKMAEIFGTKTSFLIDGENSQELSLTSIDGVPIPYYGEIDVTAGPDNLFTDGSIEPTGYIHIPSFEDCDVSFPLWGDSMWPVYQSGQIILCKEYHAWRDYIPFGEVFLVVTDNLRTVKYVKKSPNTDDFLLVSENNHYEPFEIPKKHIRRMFIVKGAIKRNVV